MTKQELKSLGTINGFKWVYNNYAKYYFVKGCYRDGFTVVEIPFPLLEGLSGDQLIRSLEIMLNEE